MVKYAVDAKLNIKSGKKFKPGIPIKKMITLEEGYNGKTISNTYR